MDGQNLPSVTHAGCQVATTAQHLLHIAILLGILLCSQPSLSHAEQLLPDESQFQTGDLIWPRPRGSHIPYAGAPMEDSETSRAQWERERAEYLGSVRQKGDAARAHEKEFADLLAELTYEDFKALYLADRQPGTPVPFGTFPVYVGHVGMLFLEHGETFVVEAVAPAIRRLTYREWLIERPNADVWHGRFTDISAKDRAAVAQMALTQIGRPYNFWNLNLDDNAGFYCSKLVWWSIFNALEIAIDDNSNPARNFWFSPKQLMAVPRMQLLFEPAPYR